MSVRDVSVVLGSRVQPVGNGNRVQIERRMLLCDGKTSQKENDNGRTCEVIFHDATTISTNFNL